jgi:chromate reductase, NAD(P)H dehydrogenase (quinone)
MPVPVVGGSAAIDRSLAPMVAAEGSNGDNAVAMRGTPGHLEVAAIAGSLRAASWARTLLRATAKQLPPNINLTIWDCLEAVPPFNEDAESGAVPTAVSDLRRLIDRSDAVFIATPEYNTSIPGVLKNALDWASRPFGKSVLRNKPVAAVGTSPLPTGGASALSDLRRVLTGIGAEVVEAELAVAHVHTRIDAGDAISDPELAAQFKQLILKVVDHATGRQLARPNA